MPSSRVGCRDYQVWCSIKSRFEVSPTQRVNLSRFNSNLGRRPVLRLTYHSVGIRGWSDYMMVPRMDTVAGQSRNQAQVGESRNLYGISSAMRVSREERRGKEGERKKKFSSKKSKNSIHRRHELCSTYPAWEVRYAELLHSQPDSYVLTACAGIISLVATRLCRDGSSANHQVYSSRVH